MADSSTVTVKPILSIIIVSFNTADITKNCLRSIFADKGLQFNLTLQDTSDKIPTEIILVDNASSDNSVPKIKQFLNSLKIGNWNLKIIQNESNVGFGQANNQGIDASVGNYLLLLNPDTIILHSSISQSLNWLSSHPEAMACTGQLLNADKSIQPSGGYFPNLANVLTWSFSLDDLPFVNYLVPPLHPHPPQFYTHDSFYLHDHPQDWITGAFMLIRRSSLGKLRFDSNYFMYGEELELSYRLHQKHPQKQTWYLVGPQIVHLGGASAIKKIDPIIREYQGILAFFGKHRPVWQLPLVKVFLKFNALLRAIIFLVTGALPKSKIYLQTCLKI